MASKAYSVDENEIVRSEHPDYKINYRTALSAMKNLNKIPGLSLKIEPAGGPGGQLPLCVLMICWCHPDLNKRAGSYACPVFLHQNMESFSNELSAAYERIRCVARLKMEIFDYKEQDMF